MKAKAAMTKGETHNKVLVVEDEEKIASAVRAYLERDGFAVITASTGKDALILAERDRPDLLVLDLRLPDMPGEEVCEKIRRRSGIPILMLTAKSSEDDKIAGFSLGADDYLVKPFSPRELAARVRALLRRAQADKPLLDIIRFDGGRFVLDLRRRALFRDGADMELTGREMDILTALAANPGIVYTREQLLDKVFGMDFEGLDRTVDVHIKNLRRKIEENPDRPRFIRTVYGKGYKFEEGSH
jgi:DNA-binding response OmpR family regulator